jgi:hypothetical protein
MSTAPMLYRRVHANIGAVRMETILCNLKGLHWGKEHEAIIMENNEQEWLTKEN